MIIPFEKIESTIAIAKSELLLIIFYKIIGHDKLKTINGLYSDGYHKYWYLNGLRHREDGPAAEWSDGTNCWYKNGKFHREDGPAIERPDGRKFWFLNGERHRKDGPACEYADGEKSYYLEGEHLSKAEFYRYIAQKAE